MKRSCIYDKQGRFAIDPQGEEIPQGSASTWRFALIQYQLMRHSQCLHCMDREHPESQPDKGLDSMNHVVTVSMSDLAAARASLSLHR